MAMRLLFIVGLFKVASADAAPQEDDAGQCERSAPAAEIDRGMFSYALLQTATSTGVGAARVFGQYKEQFGRSYAHGSDEHVMRSRLFKDRLSEIHAHNNHPVKRSWRMGVNQLTDRTEEELMQLRGFRRYKGHLTEIREHEQTCAGAEQRCDDADSCCAELVCGAHGKCLQKPKIPSSFDWTEKIPSARNIVDQSSCGSCWAIAAQGVIELQASRSINKSLELSAQGILGCAPNPHECGGKGGCEGSTPELGFRWAKDNGVTLASSVPYVAQTLCPDAEKSPAVSISGFVRLEENKPGKVLAALITAGPLAVAADASKWMSYSSGVFDDCSKTPVVDHAIVLMGFGHDSDEGVAYWKIRNSWGSDFGERGFLRLRRHAPKGKEPCGWDYEPEKGVGCKGGPKKLWVCGECGILSDVAYPIGATVDGTLALSL